MANSNKITFSNSLNLGKEVLVIFVGEDLEFSKRVKKINEGMNSHISKSIKTSGFAGDYQQTLDILTPVKSQFERVLVVGVGNEDMKTTKSWTMLGGTVMEELLKFKGKNTAILSEFPNFKGIPDVNMAYFALGLQLRNYRFDQHVSDVDGRMKTAGEFKGKHYIKICCDNYTDQRREFSALEHVAEGVAMARDLVNQPANVLGTEEFVEETKKLVQLGVQIEYLEEKNLEKIGMRALLGVSQGSARPAKVVIMRWTGLYSKEPYPIAFVGKGVVFDSGGISIKPSDGMEDMKGDMGGAAAVVGLMRALAGRKAKVDAIGIIGLVENMPDANAQRPGDVVKSMSGQTIEVINTDAEGRLVLADLLWYAQKRFGPQCLIDLATLTGAVIVALGHEYAGMYSNNDQISEGLYEAGIETGEKVWRMPLDKEYDKLIEGRVSDVKNVGGREAGSITAAQFLKRFINNAPWAHLDIAGTAMDSPKNSINQSWASGFGVMLLDRFVKNRYEK